MERRHNHGGATNPMFTPVNMGLAQGYWYFIAAVVILLTIIRGINFAQNTLR
jgi:hypothetical protein